jgi:hypothetical protein
METYYGLLSHTSVQPGRWEPTYRIMRCPFWGGVYAVTISDYIPLNGRINK